MATMGRPGVSPKEKAEPWRRWRRGETLSDIGRALGQPAGSIRGVLEPLGGIAPYLRFRQPARGPARAPFGTARTVLNQKHRREARKVLRGRADTHACERRVHHAMFDAGQSEASAVDGLAAIGKFEQLVQRRLERLLGKESVLDGVSLMCAAG